MITITVASYNGAQLAQPLAAHFDEMGGNIGRADNNQLVLPDPERTISRVHAQVVFRGGRYAIVDRGSNPISVNGRPLGNGQEAMLQAGDEISIGGYLMRVEPPGGGHGAAAVDPFADFAGLAAAPTPVSSGRSGAPAAAGFTDPLAGFGMAPTPAPRQGAPAYPAPPAYAAPSPAPSAGGIPDDWDPFAPDPVAKPAPADFARSLGTPSGGRPRTRARRTRGPVDSRHGRIGLEQRRLDRQPVRPRLPAAAAIRSPARCCTRPPPSRTWRPMPIR